MAERATTKPDPVGGDHLLDGRYRAAEEIGRGAMGVVYVAEHTRLGRRVAIKVLHDDLAEDRDACERFELEARAASRVGSPHIVDVMDAGTLDDGRRFLVMEYLRGETLKDWLEREAPVTPGQLAPLVLQLCEGLAAAHDQGIVHRDVKPDNLFLVKRAGQAPLLKILDFGVSKFRDHGTDALRSRTGVVLGTPHYMAPEQARGEREVDRRADLYAVGIVMFQALCGERPFSADNVNQLLFRVALEDVPRVDAKMPGVPSDFADIVARATAREPEQRHGSARLLARDVQRWIDRELTTGEVTPDRPTGALAVDLDTPTVTGDAVTPVRVGAEGLGADASGAAEVSAPRRPWFAVAAAALAVGGLAAVVYTGEEDASDPSSATVESAPSTEPAGADAEVDQPADAEVDADADARTEQAPTVDASRPDEEPGETLSRSSDTPSEPTPPTRAARPPHRVVEPPPTKTPRPIREEL